MRKSSKKKVPIHRRPPKLQTPADFKMTTNPFAQFNPNTTRWDPNNALALACASNLAYENSVPFQSSCRHGDSIRLVLHF
jgi:hypothetical protein